LDGGDSGKTSGRDAFFTSSAAANLLAIALISPSKAKALSKQDLMLRDGHAMAALLMETTGAADAHLDPQRNTKSMLWLDSRKPPMEIATGYPAVAQIDLHWITLT
jgi:hypothetical protein